MESIHIIDTNKIDKNTYKFCGVEAVILTQDLKILLQRRGKDWQRFPGYLSNFGGQIEDDETPIQALIRELQEELGTKVNPNDLIFLGAITENSTRNSELIYVYFWHDKNNTITGCFEGSPEYYDSTKAILDNSKVMDSVRWGIVECVNKKLLSLQ